MIARQPAGAGEPEQVPGVEDPKGPHTVCVWGRQGQGSNPSAGVNQPQTKVDSNSH